MTVLAIQTCPTTRIEASADQVWDLLTDTRRLEKWSGTKVLHAPPRIADAGDRVILGAGVGHLMRVTFEVREVAQPRQLSLEIRLPFGVVNHERIQITPIGTRACRVTYN